MAELYILHFNRPFWGRCRHYVGYTKFTAEVRAETHRAGNGSALVRFALGQGIDFLVVYKEAFDNVSETRAREQQIKRAGHIPNRLCPICKHIERR